MNSMNNLKTEALRNFSNALKKFAALNGAAGLYHQTITFAFLILIDERIRSEANAQNWEEFKANYPELFDWKNNILKRYYQEATLKSDFAKQTFVFPDKF